MGVTSSTNFFQVHRETLKLRNRSDKETLELSALPADENKIFNEKETFVTIADIESGIFASVQHKRSNGIREYIINDSSNYSNLSRIFTTINFNEDLKNSEDIIFLRINAKDENCFKELENINDTADVFRNRALVILFEENNGQKLSICFKVRNFDKFLRVKYIDTMDLAENQMLSSFIVQFLIGSFKQNHSGLYSGYDVHENTSIELHLLADNQDRNLLLIAAINGNSEIVKILLKLGLNTNQPNSDENIQDLALKENHFDVIYELIQANLTYPKNIDIENCAGQLKEFYENVKNLHQIIKDNNKEEARKILELFPDQRYFYNASNESALKIAVRNSSFEMYEYFVSQKLMFGPHEHPEVYFQQLSHDEKRIIREIHNKYTQHSPEKHLNQLMANSFICHDVCSVHEKIEYVQNAYKILNSNNLIRIILMIVAASKNFKIIFDFNHESVSAADPTVDVYTQGLFYPMGRIYIGAKQLLNEATRCETLANLAHELCHFAMNLVYKNDANPYRVNDNETSHEFEKINKACQQKSGKDDIIDTIYESYPENFHHAELIVRVVHFAAFFYNQPERLKDVQEYFRELFDFYEKKIIPEFENSLSEIENRAEKEAQKNIKKISKFRKLSIIGIVFAICGIFAAFLFGIQSYTQMRYIQDLSVNENNTLKNSLVKYKGVMVKFKELFPDNSNIYKNLSSEHIANLLKGKILDLNDPSFYFNDFVILRWKNMPEKLKDKFLNAELIFQNETLKLGETLITYENYTSLFNTMGSNQIIKILDEQKITIGQMIENKTKFYVERFILESDQKMPLNFNDVLKILKNERIFILSSDAGTGKTVTFKHYTLLLKKTFPTRWVSYIDLKDFSSEDIEKNEKTNVENLLIEILGLKEPDLKFKKSFFRKLYSTGNVILIFNGFDEVPSRHMNYVLDILLQIYKNTKNLQLICTRPLHAEALKNEFFQLIYEIAPFDESKQYEFLTKFYSQMNETERGVSNYSNKVISIINKLEASSRNSKSFDNLRTPLILEMIANLIYYDDKIYETGNIYQIYEKVVLKKIDIWAQKLKSVNYSESFIFENRKNNPIEILQKYALKEELSAYDPFLLKNSKKLSIMDKEVSRISNLPEVSKFGILYITNETVFQFAHKTFAEFFVAQYLIENIYFAGDMSENEAELRLQVLYEITRQYGKIQTTITDFINSFIQSEDNRNEKSFSRTLSSAMSKRFNRMFFHLLETEKPEIFQFLFNFFSKDKEILADLIQVNGNETLYTAALNPVYSANTNLMHVKIKEISKRYLSKEEYEKFISGKNQKGIIMYSNYSAQYSKKMTNFRKDYDEEESLMMFESIAKNLSKSELDEFLFSKFSPIYEDRLFINYKFWEILEILLPKVEVRNIFPNILEVISKVSFDDVNLDNAFPFITSKIEEHLTDLEIHDLISDGNYVHKCIDSLSAFQNIWNLFVNHTSEKQQKSLLKELIYEECVIDQYSLRVRLKRCYIFPPYNITDMDWLANHFSYHRGLENTFFQKIISDYDL